MSFPLRTSSKQREAKLVNGDGKEFSITVASVEPIAGHLKVVSFFVLFCCFFWSSQTQ